MAAGRKEEGKWRGRDEKERGGEGHQSGREERAEGGTEEGQKREKVETAGRRRPGRKSRGKGRWSPKKMKKEGRRKKRKEDTGQWSAWMTQR